MLPKKAISFTLQRSSVVACLMALMYRRVERKEDLGISDSHEQKLVLRLFDEEYWSNGFNDVHQ